MQERDAEEMTVRLPTAIRLIVLVAGFVAATLVAYYTGAETAETKMHGIAKAAVEEHAKEVGRDIAALRMAQEASDRKLDRLLELVLEDARRSRALR